jgi:DNA-binding MarR family transcriptional regulator
MACDAARYRGTISVLHMPKQPSAAKRTVKDSDYRALADFRYHIQGYLDFSDQAAKAAGLEPKQYQLLLAIKGLPEDVNPTVGVVAERLHIRHHSAVELVNRAEANNLVERKRVGSYVFVRLTKQGQRVLARAVQERLDQLHVAGPILVKTLQQLNGNQTSKRKKNR